MINFPRAIIASFLIALLQSPIALPLFAESFPFSISQTTIINDTITYQVTADNPILGYRFASRAPTPSLDQPQFPDFSPRSWTVEFTPRETLSAFAGSISWSGLPARMASPARSGLSPFASIAGVRAGATIRPSWAAGKEYLGIEWKTKYLGMVSFGSPASPRGKPAWLQFTLGIPLKKDARPAFSLSVFSGVAHRAASAEGSWFLPEPVLPERSILLPGAEIAFDLGPFSGNLMGMANLSPFSPTKLAFTGDIGFAGKLFRTGISCFLGDPSFVTLDGTLLKIRQSGCASGSIRIPLPGGPSEELAVGAAFAVKRTANLSMSEGGETLLSGSGELKASLTNLGASLRTDSDANATKISVKCGINELFTPLLALDLSSSATFPRSQFSPATWSDGTVSTKLKIARIGPLAADLQGILGKSKPHSPLGIELIARANLAFADSFTDWTIVASVSGKPLKNDYEGSLSVRADLP